MFAPDENFQPKSDDIYQSLERDDFEAPGTWVLDDFNDILYGAGAPQEAAQ